MERQLRQLFRRCVECPDEAPTCPPCASGEVCTQISATCDACAYRTCIPQANSGAAPGPPPPSSGPNVGAIAGGVVGGVALIAIATYLIWFFFLKNRRRDDEDFQLENEAYERYTGEKPRRDSSAMRAARASTHTVHSIASSVMTRASNVIPIAFIPGITSRRDGEGDVPPVPSVPLQHQQSQPNSPYSDQPPSASFLSDYRRPGSSQSNTTSGTRSPFVDEAQRDHYFMPSDLRFSTFSDSTESDRRTSVATSHMTRQSLTPSLARQSIASTIYHEAHEPAVTATRGRANVVSVHNSSRATSASRVPEVPRVDYAKYGGQASKTADGKASEAAEGAKSDSAADEAKSVEVSPPSITISPDEPAEKEVVDTVGELAPPKSNITAAIEEAARKASRQPTHGGLGSLKRDPSPFSDQHAIE